ncbi:MAG: PEP-CTERM sorting domain-containing protein [Gemmatimonas sp.]
MRTTLRIAAVVATLVPALMSAQTALDGQIGSEWTGYTPKQVLYDPNAPESNFGAPTNASKYASYDIFMRRDANWLYTAFRTTNGMTSSGLLFANLYFSVRSGAGPVGSAGQSIGIEVSNDRAFKPGGDCCFNDNGSNLIQWATSSSPGNPDIFESAINLSVFLANALGVTNFNPDPNPVGIRLNLSQTFGYSVAGGATYGDEVLGFVSTQSVVPEPSTYALMAAGLAALGVAARRRRSA